MLRYLKLVNRARTSVVLSEKVSPSILGADEVWLDDAWRTATKVSGQRILGGKCGQTMWSTARLADRPCTNAGVNSLKYHLVATCGVLDAMFKQSSKKGKIIKGIRKTDTLKWQLTGTTADPYTCKMTATVKVASHLPRASRPIVCFLTAKQDVVVNCVC